MVRPYYQRAFVELSGLPQVNRVAAQTNLSYPLKWLREVDRRSAASCVATTDHRLRARNFSDKRKNFEQWA